MARETHPTAAIARRHLLAGLPFVGLAGASALHAQPRADMTSSTPGSEQGAVQAGAGTDAGVTTGSSGPQKDGPPKKSGQEAGGGKAGGGDAPTRQRPGDAGAAPRARGADR